MNGSDIELARKGAPYISQTKLAKRLDMCDRHSIVDIEAGIVDVCDSWVAMVVRIVDELRHEELTGTDTAEPVAIQRNKEIAGRIMAERKASRPYVTLVELSKALRHVGRGTMRDIEAGLVDVTDDYLNKILQAIERLRSEARAKNAKAA